jgi:hypothetical protein
MVTIYGCARGSETAFGVITAILLIDVITIDAHTNGQGVHTPGGTNGSGPNGTRGSAPPITWSCGRVSICPPGGRATVPRALVLVGAGCVCVG